MITISGVTPTGDRATVISMTTQLADFETTLAVNNRGLQLVAETLCRGGR